MVVQAFDPRRLDIAAFAAAQAELSGDWPLASLKRLCPDAPAVGLVNWAARGERREQLEDTVQLWLHLRAGATLELVCQRCLQDMAQAVEVQRSFRFVNSEAEAERLDEECEDDVLALGQPLDLQALVEDELILGLPLVPMHGSCPQPLMPASGASPTGAQVEDHAFAALAALRRRPAGDGHDD